MIRKIVEALFPGTVRAIRTDGQAEARERFEELTGIDLAAVEADRKQQADLAKAKAQAKGRG